MGSQEKTPWLLAPATLPCSNNAMKLARILCCLTVFAVPLQAQGPDAEWRALETPSFRIYYPQASEAWTLHLANRLETIRERVAEEVGFLRSDVVDVLVLDPLARPNGSAWPILGSPRMVLYSSPPESDSILSHYRNWGQLVAVHEEVHLAHLLRPSRNPLRRMLESIAPIGPIAQRAPRWVIEGYATYLEGKLTGSGRPFSHLRATILRRWAQQGELPSYYRLSADTRDWLGMSMAYLAGSAYLQWLVDSAGEESLRNLWQRLSAVRNRSFSDAFAGVFGDSPEKLYNRFRAELTYEAIRLELKASAADSGGELWQDLSWTSGLPDVSPDGEHLALVLRSRKGPQRLVVWATGDGPPARDRWTAEVEALLAADPDDVPAGSFRPLPRQPVHELKARLGTGFFSPRFFPDGRSILHVRFEPDGQGFLHPDLFEWDLETGSVERLTRGADVRDADPSPSGEWAVAVRNRHGYSQLVAVDLETSGIEPLTEPSIHTVFDQPRISPDGRQLTCVRHSEGRWQLAVWNLEGSRLKSPEPKIFPTPEGSTITHPSWSPDGREIYASVGEKGFLRLVAFDLETEENRILSQSQDGQLAPEPAPDGKSLFFLSLDSEGLDLRSLPLHRSEEPSGQDASKVEKKGPSSASLQAMLEPVAPESSPLPGSKSSSELLERRESRSYGIGRLEMLPLLSGSWSPSRRAVEVGLRLGDVLGRTEILTLGVDGETETGGAASLTWRGWPWTVSGQIFTARERPSRQSERVPGLGDSLDLDHSGIELTVSRSYLARSYRVGLTGGWYLGEVERASSDQELERSILFARPSVVLSQQLGASWTVSEEAHLDLASGRTEEDSWNRWLVTFRLSTRIRRGSLRLAWARGESKSTEFLFDRFQVGGLSGSILPDSGAGSRIEAPGLPMATRIGDEYEGQSLSVRSGRFPVRFFYERHRTPDDAKERNWLALRGVELRLTGRARPLLRLPAYELRLGVAEILDEPFQGDINWWLGLSFRPGNSAQP